MLKADPRLAMQPQDSAETAPARDAAGPSAAADTAVRGALLQRVLQELAALRDGPEALARRGDIKALHDRVMGQLHALQAATGQARPESPLDASTAAADRLAERLHELERTVDSLEGALHVTLSQRLPEEVAVALAPALRRSRNQSATLVLSAVAAAASLLGLALVTVLQWPEITALLARG